MDEHGSEISPVGRGVKSAETQPTCILSDPFIRVNPRLVFYLLELLMRDHHLLDRRWQRMNLAAREAAVGKHALEL